MTGYDTREYQEIGTKFLSVIRRGFLTDDPGLGKSIQAIRATELPAMVVAPRYLIGQWQDSIRREHEDAVIALADGTRVQRDKILSKKADWYIVNPEMLPSYELPTNIRTFINDESHHLRNRRALKSKAAKAIENEDPKSRIYHLSATPFWKSVDDIWHQAHILYPKVFTSYHEFVKLYCNSLAHPQGGMKVIGVKKKMKADLKALLSPIMLGRTYAEVGRYLPEVIESTITLDLPRELLALYNHLAKNFNLKWEDEEEQKKMIFNPVTVLHALRQITMRAGKIDVIVDLLEDRNNKPAVIGFWYKDHAAMMYERIKDKAVLITGDMDSIERERLAYWAQSNKKHIVASERSLSEGLNLYHYRIFIFGEEHYVPGMNHQFVSRVVRDRNDNGLDKEPVEVFYTIVRGTTDTDIHRIARSRKKSIEATRELLELTLGRKGHNFHENGESTY